MDGKYKNFGLENSYKMFIPVLLGVHETYTLPSLNLSLLLQGIQTYL